MGETRKYTFILFSIALLFPSFASLSHILAHEKHEVCSNYSEVHYHNDNFDCELCDLHAGSFEAFIPLNYSLFTPPTAFETSFEGYSFMAHLGKLSFELRGPPTPIHPNSLG